MICMLREGRMRNYFMVALAMFVVSGCSSVVEKKFKVFTDPADATIRVVSGTELKELKYRSPAAITAEVPTDPALADKTVVDISRDNYKPRLIPLRDIKDGVTLNIKLEKIARDIARYRIACRLASPTASQELQFKDKTIGVSFSIGEQSFQMRFENVSDVPVKIQWERAQYIDVNGQPQRLMHSGIRYVDRNNPIPDQMVAPHGVVEEAVIPVSNVFVSPQKNGYDIRPLLPLDSDAAAGLKGKSIILFIPVEVNRQIIPYNFKIEITDCIKETVKG
jgi:hypothetical protein